MPKAKQILKSAIDDITHDHNHSTLDTCIKSLANNNIQLREAGKIGDAIVPLSEADIRGKNLDLGALAAQGDTLDQCLKKFSEHGLVKYDGPSNILDAGKEVLHSAAQAVADEL